MVHSVSPGLGQYLRVWKKQPINPDVGLGWLASTNLCILPTRLSQDNSSKIGPLKVSQRSHLMLLKIVMILMGMMSWWNLIRMHAFTCSAWQLHLPGRGRTQWPMASPHSGVKRASQPQLSPMVDQRHRRPPQPELGYPGRNKSLIYSDPLHVISKGCGATRRLAGMGGCLESCTGLRGSHLFLQWSTDPNKSSHRGSLSQIRDLPKAYNQITSVV